MFYFSIIRLLMWEHASWIWFTCIITTFQPVKNMYQWCNTSSEQVFRRKLLTFYMLLESCWYICIYIYIYIFMTHTQISVYKVPSHIIIRKFYICSRLIQCLRAFLNSRWKKESVYSAKHRKYNIKNNLSIIT